MTPLTQRGTLGLSGDQVKPGSPAADSRAHPPSTPSVGLDGFVWKMGVMPVPAVRGCWGRRVSRAGLTPRVTVVLLCKWPSLAELFYT